MVPLSRELLQQLYGTPPERFVAARDAAATDARRSGDRAAARDIAQLRRPTVAAWLVNLLAIRRPELVADLAQLAEALRAAQRDLSGSTLRDLTAQRRALVGALVAEARRLAVGVEGAPPVGRLPFAEVETTLNAALADPAVAEQVRSGRLLRSASYAGFGEVPRPQLRLVTGDGETPADAAGHGVGDQRAHRGRRRRALDRDLAQARADQERTEADLTGARDAERDAVDTLAAIEAELAEVERRRAAAEQEVSRRTLARRQAERAVAAVRRRVGQIEEARAGLAADESASGGPEGTVD